MKGVPQKAPRDLLGQPWGSRWPGGAIYGHSRSPFWIPFGTLDAKGATLGAPVASPWAPFASLLCPFLQSVLQGRRCGWHRCSAEGPWGVKMLVLHAKYRCFAKVRVWSPRCQKGLPRGAPGRVFGHLLTTFWNTLASLSPPAATLRPHFDTVVKKVRNYAYLLHFGSIRDPSQPVNPQARRSTPGPRYISLRSILMHLGCLCQLHSR